MFLTSIHPECSVDVPVSDSGKCTYCQEPTKFRCTACESAYYCCTQHQLEDWPKHKSQCFPYKERQSREYGIHLVATRDIKKGEIVITQDPFVFGPSNLDSKPCCIGCSGSLNPDDEAVCSRCDWPVCKSNCPGLAKDHRAECKFMKKLKLKVGLAWDLVLIYRSALLNVTDHRTVMSEKKCVPVTASAESIPTANAPDRAKTTALLELLSELPPMSDDWSPRGVENFFCTIQGILNVYSLRYETKDRMLAGLYENASLLHQSCPSNCRPCFEDEEPVFYQKKGPRAPAPLKKVPEEAKEEMHDDPTQGKKSPEERKRKRKKGSRARAPLKKVPEEAKEEMHDDPTQGKKSPEERKRKTSSSKTDLPNRGRVFVKAIRDIRKGDILTCNHTQPLMCTIRRQHDLWTKKNLICNCIRCLDARELDTDFGTVKCLEPECTGPMFPINQERVYTTAWKCQDCNSELDARKVWMRVERFVKMYQIVSKEEMMGRMDLKTLEQMVTDFEKQLHPNHEACVALKYVVMRSYGYSPTTVGIGALDDKLLKRRADLGRLIVRIVLKLGPSVNKAEKLITVCLVEHSKTILECINRYFETDGSWTHERARRNVLACFKYLKLASEILDMENILIRDQDYDLYVTLIHAIGKELLNKANKNDWEVPEELLDY